MRLGKFTLMLALLATALLVPVRSAAVESNSTVVATVGNEKLTVGDVQQRLRQVPTFQLKTYGKTPREIRKNFVEKVMIPEMLAAQEARRRKLDKDPEVAARIRGVLREAMLKAFEQQLDKTPIPDASVRIYYHSHAKDFDTPLRIRIWRILVRDKASAEQIIKEVQGTNGPKRWGRIARMHSLDKATALRNGSLGFVFPDGRTAVPRVRVDPALFAAAKKVQDGQLVPEPVQEGKQWAVVWRRGSMPAVHRTLQDETRSIRHILRRQRFEDSLKALLTKLEKEHVRDKNEKLLEYVNVDNNGDVGSPDRAGLLPRRPPRGSPTPTQTQNGLR